MIGVYKITSPSGKVYIGASKNIKRREWHYQSGDCKNQVRLYNSISEFGWDAHKFEVIEECEESELRKRENFYGKMFNALGPNGLNGMLPKILDTDVAISEETRIKRSISKQGIKNSFFGKTHTEETKAKISKCQTGRKHTEEHKRKVSENNAKNLAKIVLDLNTGVFYESAKEAALYNGFKHPTLKSQLNGSNKNRTSLIYC